MKQIRSSAAERSCLAVTRRPTAPAPEPVDGRATRPRAALDGAGEIEIADRLYITAQRLATKLCVSVRTLARWNSRGIGPPKITIGKTILFDLAKLPEWLASREAQPVRNTRNR